MQTRSQSLAVRVALGYAVGASLWIFLSDLALGLYSGARMSLVLAGMSKGLLFVAITTGLLFLILRRLLKAEVDAHARAEQAAEKLSEAQLISEHSGEILYKHDVHHRITYVSSKFQVICGYSPAEIQGEWTRLVTENPINKEALEHTERAIRTGEKQPPYLLEIRKKDGSPVLFEIYESPVKDLSGKVVAIAGAARDVTAREVAQRTLKDLYQTMNEGLALHELVFDGAGKPVDYRVIEVNPAFERITGFSREAVLGKLASAVYGLADAPFLEIYSHVAQTGQATSFETEFAPMRKHLTISAFSPRSGQFATVFSDITKRREAEEQIVLLNRVYALVSHISEAIVRISDRETLFREACRITVDQGHFQMGWIGLFDAVNSAVSPAASAGMDNGYLDRAAQIAKTNGAGFGPVLEAAREGKVVITQDISESPEMAPWRDLCREREFRSAVSLPLKTGGNVVAVFTVYSAEPAFFTAMITESLIEVTSDLSFALDLFERNREREREQQQLRLQHSALDAAANSIVITDRDGRIEWVNEAFTRLTGYQREEALGRKPDLLKSGLHDESFYRRMWQTIQAGKVWQGSLRNKRKDGTIYFEEMTITPVRSQEGEISHFIAIKQDITERRKLEQQFLRAQRMQSIGLLAGGVAHDLNNVLAPVIMAVPLLRGNLEADQREQILDTLERSVQRGANIVQQVLTFARGIEVQRTLVQLRHLVREIAKVAAETFPRDITIKTTVPSDLWLFQGDPTQIHQVLLNLAVNARDAMPNGGQLSFTARNLELKEPLEFMDFELVPGSYVSVSVSDTGMGITPDILDRIFEPFFTTKPVGKGTGLGLSTVLGIVKSHDGLVEVKTRPGHGSTFTVYLPAAPQDVVPVELAPRQEIPRGNGETVMIVDDEVGILQLTQSTLEAHGYKVVAARDGVQGLARFAENADTVGVVLTDIMMPQMDGVGLVRALRKVNPDVPIIASTGLLNAHGDGDRAATLRDLGVQQFLYKPFQNEELLRALHLALHPERVEG